MSIAAEYLETQVLTATPHRLHLMVVDAALRSIHRGLDALDGQRWEEMDAAFSKARDCVTELIGGLKADAAPGVVEPLKALFLFAYRSLVEGELQRNPQRIHSARRVLELHRQTWVELGESLQRPAAEPVPQPHARSWLG